MSMASPTAWGPSSGPTTAAPQTVSRASASCACGPTRNWAHRPHAQAHSFYPKCCQLDPQPSAPPLHNAPTVLQPMTASVWTSCARITKCVRPASVWNRTARSGADLTSSTVSETTRGGGIVSLGCGVGCELAKGTMSAWSGVEVVAAVSSHMVWGGGGRTTGGALPQQAAAGVWPAGALQPAWLGERPGLERPSAH
jgi:hypothetical protein